MIFQKFRTRFLPFWRNLRFCVVQAGSTLGKEVRGLGRALRRLIPSKQPMGQLRTQWWCQDNCVIASSSSKRPWNFEFFDVTFWTIFS